jgi:type IV pilus assembly protein PilQ
MAIDHSASKTSRDLSMTISTLILATVLRSSQLVSIDTKEMDLNDFLRLMANIANINVVLHSGVQGKVNLMVKDALWEQLLDAVLKNHGLAKEFEGNIMRIAPSTVFEAERKQAAAIEEARLNALPLQTHIYFLNYAKADDVVLVVSKLLSPRGSAVAYRSRNAVIVRDVVRPPESIR